MKGKPSGDLGLRSPITFYICIYIYFHHTTCEITCPHQPPTRGVNKVSVAQSRTATPGANKQLLPPDWILRELYIYIYIYTPDQYKSRDYIGRQSSFLSVQIVILKKKKKNAFTFGR